MLLLAVMAGGAPVVVAWLTKLTLDGLVDGVPSSRLVGLAVLLATAGIAAVALPALTRYTESEFGRRVRVTAVSRLFTAMRERLIGLARLEDPAFHTRLRLAQQAGSSGPSDLVSGVIGIATSAVTLTGFAVTLGLINPWLVLAVGISAIPTLRAELRLSRLRAGAMWRIGYAARRQYFYASLLSEPREAKEIRLFGLGGFFQQRMVAELLSANAENRRLDRRELGVQAVLGALGAMIAGGGLVWGIMAARTGELSIGDVTVFATAVAAVQGAMAATVSRFAAVHEALLMLDHYHAAITVPVDLPVPERPRAVPPLREGITFQDVWFRYGPDQPWVLRGVDLLIEAGRATALVGLNGAGKSTVVKLLCRLYDPVRGSIRWDGVDVREFDPDDLRDRIGTVFQDYMEYELSAAENIGLGDLARLDDRAGIEGAARRAGMHEALTRLPKGYDTLLTRMYIEGIDSADSDTGVLLSGGQGQRVAFARALFRGDRDLLILDEPSSGLDAEAEVAMHRQLREHRAGRTSLLISHRLGTLRDADEIAVLSEGVVAERGDHEQLIRAEGSYARLFQLQADGYVGGAVRQ
ncbi:ABC transporter ATP-binding protein [Micromonospora echinofusca]|uniref:ABC transporter ATP-binding protein n=1 Tax=Micromonospora echinofusca TaxID=47858 RepID=UPI0033C6F84D